MKKKKFALVLSGGGFNGAFQLGALNYINENWKSISGLDSPMKFDLIAGVSVGALNGALLAMNQLDLLNDLWVNQIGRNGVSEIYTSEFINTSSKSDKIKLKVDLKKLVKKLLPEVNIQLNFFKKLGLVFSKKQRAKIIENALKQVEKSIQLNLPKFRSIADNTPLSKKLDKYLDRSTITDTTYMCGFVSLDTGAYHSVKHSEFYSDKDFHQGVLASTAIPMIWNPVESVSFYGKNGVYTSKNNVDGGVRNVSPLGDVIKLINQDPNSEYKIIVINCNSGTPKVEDYSGKSIAAIAARSVYEIAITEVFNNDVEHFTKLNDVVKQAQAWDSEIVLFGSDKHQIKDFDAVIINPSKGIDMGSSLVANEKLIANRMIHGRTMAQLAFDKKDVHNA
ncbi:NTE family protein [Lishizhenia tianjinensis]|uniref:NTE family protein n=1 Tax=Lishizhenia tianjinensis TaxID=477690 RepID=A0A1I7AJX6_9FLAO|nr:patatin-like phospholipase family protein [Lishizhenia tianjinensis]SFT75237.1 NTE family protein [Lishizhenia tianjinensis]